MKQLELRDDGTVVIRAGAEEWVLRRPTLGEYRRLFEMYRDAGKAIRAAVEAVPLLEDGSVNDDERIRIANDMQLGSEAQAPIYAAVLAQYIAALSDQDPPDPSDLPAFTVSSVFLDRIIPHWRAVPLDLGPSD